TPAPCHSPPPPAHSNPVAGSPMMWLMGQPSQNGPFSFQPSLLLPPDIRKAPLVVPTSIVTPSWLIAVVLRFLDHAPSCSACFKAGLERLLCAFATQPIAAAAPAPRSRVGGFGSFAISVAKSRSPQMFALFRNRQNHSFAAKCREASKQAYAVHQPMSA